MEPQSKKEIRTEKKRKKLEAEYQLSLQNDQLKRPGLLLDSDDPTVKKLRMEPSDNVNKRLNPTELKELKKLLNERKKILTQLPRFLLQNAGITSSMSTSHDLREPIFMSDIQQLLLYALGGNNLSLPPTRWCNLQKANRLTHVVALIVEGITSSDFTTHEHLFPKLTLHFQDRVEVMAPGYYGRTVAQELSCIPLSNAQKENILKQYGSMEQAVSEKEITKQFRALFPTHIKASDNVSAPPLELPASDIFPRTYLLLGLNQMTFEGYPLPFFQQMNKAKYADYKFSKEKYKEVTANSPMFAIDCEMCITTTNPSELTKIAVINEKLETVYTTLVKPAAPITNYLTRFSGITEETLKDVTTTLEDVQNALINLLPEDSIWIGQSLNCDLHALKLMHPYVVDTSIIFNLSGVEGRKSKLSHLAEEFLGEEIQTGKDGHCPIQDAKAAMKLVKLKLAQGFLFGDNVAATENPKIPESILTTSIFNKTYKSNKTVAVIGPEEVLHEYKSVTINPPDRTAFTPLLSEKSTSSIEKLAEVATSNQLTIAHVDISSKLKKQKKDKYLSKLDDWCDNVYNHVSVNGMCIVLFAGPNPSTTDTSEKPPSSPPQIKSSEPIPSPDSKKQNTTIVKPRHNGVCFIKVNTKKV